MSVAVVEWHMLQYTWTAMAVHLVVSVSASKGHVVAHVQVES